MSVAMARKINRIFWRIAKRGELSRTPKPWYRGGVLYASDGSILIRAGVSPIVFDSHPRIAVTRFDLGDEGYHPSHADQLIDDAFARPDWIAAEIPEVQAVRTYQLSDGIVRKQEIREGIKFARDGGDYLLNSLYLAMLRKSGVRTVAYSPFPAGDDCARFTGDGFHGILMPMR
mgnify:CR=1 FL=1